MDNLLNLSTVVWSLQLLQVVQTHQTLVSCLGLVLLQKKPVKWVCRSVLVFQNCTFYSLRGRYIFSHMQLKYVRTRLNHGLKQVLLPVLGLLQNIWNGGMQLVSNLPLDHLITISNLTPLSLVFPVPDIF